MKVKKFKHLIQYGEYLSDLYPELHVPKDGTNRAETRRMTKTFTFQVTDKCNLACTYCYQINKSTRRMSFETARKAVDALLTGEKNFDAYMSPDDSPGIILEFIGGEPFLEVDLIDQIAEYFRLRAIELNHPWKDKYMLSICSNGVLYRDPRVQKFLSKYFDCLSFSVTIDGTKELHDSCRIFPDGKPSYDVAHDAAMDWMARGYKMGSKITMAPANVQYMFECLKQMVLDGYYEINFNTVFEKGWTTADATVIYWQIKQFVDWFFLNVEDPSEYSLSYFNMTSACPLTPTYNDNWCGTTSAMMAMDPDGKLFTCIRFMESSLGKEIPEYSIGHIDTGLFYTEEEKQRIKCLNCITRRSQSEDKCFDCVIASGCAWCTGYNYQECGTPDKRVDYSCEVHKARALLTFYFKNKAYFEYNVGEPCHLFTPKHWAVPIIGEEEYNYLVGIAEKYGLLVNRNESERWQDLDFTLSELQGNLLGVTTPLKDFAR